MGDLFFWTGSLSENSKSYVNKRNYKYNYCGFQPLADVVRHVENGYKMEAPEGCPAEIYKIMKQVCY